MVILRGWSSLVLNESESFIQYLFLSYGMFLMLFFTADGRKFLFLKRLNFKMNGCRIFCF